MLLDQSQPLVKSCGAPVLKPLAKQSEAPTARASLLQVVKRSINTCRTDIEILLAILHRLFQNTHVLGVYLLSRDFFPARAPHRDIQPNPKLMSQEQT